MLYCQVKYLRRVLVNLAGISDLWQASIGLVIVVITMLNWVNFVQLF